MECSKRAIKCVCVCAVCVCAANEIQFLSQKQQQQQHTLLNDNKMKGWNRTQSVVGDPKKNTCTHRHFISLFSRLFFRLKSFVFFSQKIWDSLTVADVFNPDWTINVVKPTVVGFISFFIVFNDPLGWQPITTRSIDRSIDADSIAKINRILIWHLLIFLNHKNDPTWWWWW